MDVFGGAPRFLAYPRPVVVQSGTDAVLKCQIGGDPRPAVIWESNNIKIDTQGRYRVFEDGNVYNLIISSVTSEDSGQYICKAKNSIGETYAAATLKVEGEAQNPASRSRRSPPSGPVPRAPSWPPGLSATSPRSTRTCAPWSGKTGPARPPSTPGPPSERELPL